MEQTGSVLPGLKRIYATYLTHLGAGHHTITLDEIPLVHKLAVIKPRTGKGSPLKRKHGIDGKHGITAGNRLEQRFEIVHVVNLVEPRIRKLGAGHGYLLVAAHFVVTQLKLGTAEARRERYQHVSI